MFRGLPLVECERGESVWQAAARAGYAEPLHRVGAKAYSKPGDGEEFVAWVKVGKRSVPLPIFVKKEDAK